MSGGSENYDKYLYPTYDDRNFNKKIYNKKEFYDLVAKQSDEVNSTEEFMKIVEKANENDSDSSFKLANYQRFVRNFLSFQTPYNSLLLYHGLGTGKTCSAILIAEEMREYTRLLGMPTKKTIYVVCNEAVQSNFESQLFDISKVEFRNNIMKMNTCVGEKIIKEFFDHLKQPNYVKKTEDEVKLKEEFKMYYNNNIKPAYQYINYGSIPKGNYKQYANKLFVIDEVHNIKDQGEEEVPKPNKKYDLKLKRTNGKDKISYVNATFSKKKDDGKYVFTINENDERKIEVSLDEIVFNRGSRSDVLTELIQNVDNMKLLFLSATPMFDKASEIITILNFMRMNDNRHTINEENLKNIEEFARGYVSFVPGGNPYTFPFRLYPALFSFDNSNANLKIPTNNENLSFEDHEAKLNEIKKFQIDLYMNKMSEKQLETYKLVEEAANNVEDIGVRVDPNKDNEKSGATIQNTHKLNYALIMTYPENKISSKDSNDDGIGLVCVKNNDQYRMKKGKEEFFGIDSLKEYGCKLATVIEQVEKTEGIILVYSHYIDAALIPLALALETAGYVRTTDGTNQSPLLSSENDKKNKKKEKEKYALITGESDKNRALLLSKIKSKDNCKGEKIKVILISDAGTEGIDFKNIRQVHILNPWFNMSRIEQVIGRAVRNNSHRDLDFKDRNVEIYMHCAYSDNYPETNDFKTYSAAYEKAKKIGEINRKLKEHSIDCLINKDDNKYFVKNDLKVEQRPVSFNEGKTVNVKVGDLDYSMNCDYGKCEKIDCDIGDNKIVDNKKVDTSTFNESFIFMNNDDIISRIQELFLYRTYYERRSLYEEITITSRFPYSQEQISISLSELIENKYKYLIYNKVADECGYIVNVGDYYMFQPSLLTYPKIDNVERRTKIPTSRLLVSDESINDLEIYKDLVKLKECIGDNSLKLLLLNNKKEEMSGNENIVDFIIERYKKNDNDDFQDKVNFWVEYMKLCLRIKKVNELLNPKTDSKSSNKCTEFYEYVVDKIKNDTNRDIDNDTNREIDNMNDTIIIIQNYIDSLSCQSQINLVRFLLSDNNDHKNAKDMDMVIREIINNKDDNTDYNKLIKNYIEKNIVNNQYILFQNYNTKEVLLYYFNSNASNELYKVVDEKKEIISKIKNNENIFSKFKSCKKISFYDVVKSPPKNYKILVDDGTGTSKGKNCESISNTTGSDAQKKKRKGRSPKNSDSEATNKKTECFKKEYYARLRRLNEGKEGNICASQSEESQESDELGILYFSEFAIFADLLSYSFNHDNEKK